MAKRYKYSFAQRQEAKEGIISSVFAGISVLIFLSAIIISFGFQGKGGMYLGAMGLVAILLSIYGFIRGLKSFGVPERTHKFGIIGSLANGVIVVVWLALFLVGIS